MTLLHTVDWLVDAIALALAVWDTTQTGTGQETNATRNNTGLITDDISKQVASHDNTIKSSWVLDHKHGSAINQVVTNLQLGELLSHELGGNLSPESAGSQNVGLVQGPDWERRVMLQGQVGSKSDNSLDLWARVWLGVPGGSVTIVLLALSKVDTSGQLSDDIEVGTTADLSLERRDIDEGFGGKVAWAKIAVCAHLFSELEDTLLRTNLAGSPFWTTNGTKEDGVRVLCSCESFGGQWLTSGIDGSLWKIS